MKLKRGVKLRGLTPACLLAMMVAEGLYKENGYGLRITSICEGKHSRGSLHYVGQAFDCGIRLPPNAPQMLRNELKKRLGAEFDVVLESNHIHVEYQPKTA